jgi:hypothetical protein
MKYAMPNPQTERRLARCFPTKHRLTASALLFALHNVIAQRTNTWFLEERAMDAKQPNYEVPAEMRDFAEKSVEQARKAIDGFMGAARKTPIRSKAPPRPFRSAARI